MKKSLSVVALVLLLMCLAAPAPARAEAGFGRATLGEIVHPVGLRLEPKQGVNSIQRWNRIAIDASGLDHTPVAPGEDRVFGEQLGPGRSSRAMAIMHIAMFDVVSAVYGTYESYTGVEAPPGPISLDAAIVKAGHDSLVALFPSHAEIFGARLAEDLRQIRQGKQRTNGLELGRRAAAAILAMRAGDGADHPEPMLGVGHMASDMPGHWRQDPVSQLPVALGAYWGTCEPFVIEAGDQFRTPPPPPMESPAYAAAFDEVQRLGGDGVNTPTQRTAEETFIGIFWAYDGTPSLCAPPRLYNQIAVQIANQMRLGTAELARLLVLVNVAMADAGVAIWESKYYYDVWRPVTGIRESDPGTGPTGLGDGNAATFGDPSFMPLGAPASNLTGPNFTPPFPAYPSGHAGFGGALFQILRRYFETDQLPFTFVSDEFNGETLDNQGNVRPFQPRGFATFSEAEEENGQSRIYLGIHWEFDKTEGITQGRRVADAVFDNAFRPLHPPAP